MPKFSSVVAIGVCVVCAHPASGQQCMLPAHPAFEFQVDAPATVIPDSTHPHPAVSRFAASKNDPEAIIVQFVVDTTGAPVEKSLRILKSPSAAIADSVRAAFPLWRFTPSRKGGCRVSQLVQTTVVR